MNMNHLHLDSLVYQVANKRILNNLFFQLQTGEIVEITGLNGAGKSTFLEILFGTKKAQHIFIRINNQVIQNPNMHAKYFALKTQFTFFPKQLKLKQVLPKAYMNWPEFQEKANTPIPQFSTGIQQLIQTLFVLNLPQPFYLLDEPFTGLSPLLQERLLLVIQNKAQTKGIVIVNHIPHILYPIRTRQLQLHKGNLSSLT